MALPGRRKPGRGAAAAAYGGGDPQAMERFIPSDGAGSSISSDRTRAMRAGSWRAVSL